MKIFSIRRFSQFIGRSDVKKNILYAFLKRIFWRLRWKIKEENFLIPLGEDLKVYVPQSGSASLIYYQGYSELETAEFIHRFLRPEMVLFDIGAHIGEYTLLAAKIVGDDGEIHSFEPQPNLSKILEQNVAINNFSNIKLNRCAVSNINDEVEFALHKEPSVSSIRKQNSDQEGVRIITVPCITLDDYWNSSNRRIDLIKVDVEGAEKFVFEGAKKLLGLPSENAPIWLFEYACSAYKAFGYQASDLLEMLNAHSYKVYRYHSGGRLEEFDPSSPIRGIVNLVATKDYNHVHSLISNRELSLL